MTLKLDTIKMMAKVYHLSNRIISYEVAPSARRSIAEKAKQMAIDDLAEMVTDNHSYEELFDLDSDGHGNVVVIPKPLLMTLIGGTE